MQSWLASLQNADAYRGKPLAESRGSVLAESVPCVWGRSRSVTIPLLAQVLRLPYCENMETVLLWMFPIALQNSRIAVSRRLWRRLRSGSIGKEKSQSKKAAGEAIGGAGSVAVLGVHPE